jgi:hypothetical protein
MTPGNCARWDFHFLPESRSTSQSRQSELAMLVFVTINPQGHVVPYAARF